MSKTYAELYKLWLAFDAAEHFASKTKIARDIASVEYLDEEVRAVNDILRKVTWGGVHLFPLEYSAFVVKAWDYTFTWNGSFNLFFVDEDGLPIEMALNLTQEQVLDAFKGMVVRASSSAVTCADNSDGIRYHVENPDFSEISETTMLAAYDFLVARHNLMDKVPTADKAFMRMELRDSLYEFITE